MSADLKADILKAAEESKRLEEKMLKRRTKKHRYFIIKFPNGVESLIKCNNGWAGLNKYIKYFKDEYDDPIVVVAISKSEARKFTRKGVLFTC